MSSSAWGFLNGCFWHRSYIHPPNRRVFSAQLVVPCACGFTGEVLHEPQQRASLQGVSSSKEYPGPPGKNERQARP